MRTIRQSKKVLEEYGAECEAWERPDGWWLDMVFVHRNCFIKMPTGFEIDGQHKGGWKSKRAAYDAAATWVEENLKRGKK